MSTELKQSLGLYLENGADHKWLQTTSIFQAKRSGNSILHYQAELPLDGSNKGYFVRIMDGNGHLVKDTYTSYTANKNPVSGTIKSDDLRLKEQNYVLEFGPHFSDRDVNAVGATVNLMNGRPRNFQSSAVYYADNTAKSVLFDFNVPPSIFDNNTKVKVYLVKGNKIREERYAIEGKTYELSPKSHSGDGEINFNEALSNGGTYTLCMGIYSTVRQIASNTFIWE